MDKHTKLFLAVILGVSFAVSLLQLPAFIKIQNEKYDMDTSSDLSSLKANITSYAVNNAKLPADLSQLSSNEGKLVHKISAYTYTVKSTDTYELCAVFKTKAATEIAPGADIYMKSTYENFSDHPVGRHCFTLTEAYLTKVIKPRTMPPSPTPKTPNPLQCQYQTGITTDVCIPVTTN